MTRALPTAPAAAARRDDEAAATQRGESDAARPEAAAAAWSQPHAGTLAGTLAQRFQAHIEQRLMSPGARLPSVRECARRHRVSPSTVVSAYDLLQARGLVEARAKRGYFVRAARTTAAAAPAVRAPAVAPVDATALIRSMFQARGGPLSPGMGTLPAEWLDAPLLQRALRRASGAASAHGWLHYGDPAGHAALREALVRQLAQLGIAAAPGQIVTTMGATHGLDIVARTLLQPGDAVLVDEPGWAVEFARLTRAGFRLLPVPRGTEGPDLEVMAALLRAHRPRLYVTVSVLHNPTGASLSPAAAHHVLRLAEAHALTIVEDDTYAWLAPPHATRLAQLDGLARTIYVSGFSKIVTPQWRVGFIAAAPELAERFIDTKLLGALTTPSPCEEALAWCLDQGALRRHAERVVQRLDAARSRTERLVREAGLRFATPPHGLFGWLDVGQDTDRLAERMLHEGWLIAPGSLFHAPPRPTTLMRVSFAAGQDARFWRALAAHSPPR